METENMRNCQSKDEHESVMKHWTILICIIVILMIINALAVILLGLIWLPFPIGDAPLFEKVLVIITLLFNFLLLYLFYVVFKTVSTSFLDIALIRYSLFKKSGN